MTGAPPPCGENELQEKRAILSQYSEGHITWRQAAQELGLDDFPAFENALREHGLPLYEPDSQESQMKMAALDALLDEGL